MSKEKILLDQLNEWMDDFPSKKVVRNILGELNKQYALLDVALDDLFQANEDLIREKDNLENEENMHLNSGNVNSPNERGRKAQLASLTKEYACHVFQAERVKREAGHIVERESLRLKRLRDVIKLLTITGEHMRGD